MNRVLASAVLKLGKLRLLKATRELPGPFLQKETGPASFTALGLGRPEPPPRLWTRSGASRSAMPHGTECS